MKKKTEKEKTVLNIKCRLKQELAKSDEKHKKGSFRRTK